MNQHPTPIRITDGEWQFVNGDWHDFEDAALGVEPDDVRRDGTSIQGHHYAFAKHLSFRDVQVTFDFRVGDHTDAGIVLHATDESSFYLLHFPGCAQSSRGQHFFAALSRMDHDGYLRCIKLELVRRVPSHPIDWKTARLELEGNRISVQIGDHGLFEVSDPGLGGVGCVGLHFSSLNPENNAVLRNVVVEGEPIAGGWDDRVRQPTNWFKPVPRDDQVWQMPWDLIELHDGRLLLTYIVQDTPDTSGEAPRAQFLARSSDRGRSWSDPVRLRLVDEDEAWLPPRLHLTPAGRLIALAKQGDRFLVAESIDGAENWTTPSPVNLPVTAKGGNVNFNIGPQGFLNLADGSMLVFGYGRVNMDNTDSIHTWGGWHCQAFSCRSTDDGRTWSDPINVDNRGCERDGAPIDGNMDLTEVQAVQTGGGSIMALIRPVYSPWMWETWSRDGGVTWGPCMRGPFPGYATTNLLRTKAGALLIAHRQPCMTIHCSRDDGHTWDEGTLTDSGLWCMGIMREVEPDLVLHVYWDSFQSHMRAQFLRVTPTGLVPGGAS